MKPSLSIVLPVHNAESTLRHDVLCVLEVAEQLSDRLEVLIFDDGSTDQTIDVAEELAKCFPQVAVARRSVRCGLGPIVESALAETAGNVVMVHDGMSGIDVEGIQRLWRLRDDQELVLLRNGLPRRASTRWVDHLTGRSRRRGPRRFSTERSTSFTMLRRGAVEAMSDNEHLEITREEVRIAQYAPTSEPAHRLQGPSFLGKLKEFAEGE
ncbi:MAG: glycosyltransferase [Thermoguttaceae bacterium]